MLRRTHVYKNQDAVALSASVNSTPVQVLDRTGFSLIAAWSEAATPAKTFASGSAEVIEVTCVADVSSSLNDTYFTINSINALTEATKAFYVWFNVGGAGTDPAIAGKTPIPVALTADDSDDTVAINLESALAALTDDFSVTRLNEVVTITNVINGAVAGPLDTGTTGFTFSVTNVGVVTDISLLNNSVTKLLHGYVTGQKVAVTTTGSLPTGVPATAFIVAVDENHISFASSKANALASTLVTISTFGSGTQTMTRQALNGTLTLQASNDFNPDVRPVVAGTWTDVTGSAVTMAGAGTYGWNVSDVYYAWVRLAYAWNAGDGVVSSTVCVKD
jgi:hypothetical protein